MGPQPSLTITIARRLSGTVEFTCSHTLNLTMTLERHYFTDEEIEPWKGSTPDTSSRANSSQASP